MKWRIFHTSSAWSDSCIVSDHFSKCWKSRRHTHTSTVWQSLLYSFSGAKTTASTDTGIHSCHVLTFLFYVFVLGWSRRELGWGVYVLFSMLYFLRVWPSMVLNQRQVSFVVSHWESYLGSLFPLVFCVWLFSVVCLHHTELFRFCLSLCCFVIQCAVDLLNINMDTYHAAHWSDLDYSSSDDEENCYTIASPKKSFQHTSVKW